MKCDRVLIRNFKAISEVEIDLTHITLLVGGNNAGKSSVLQALHLASRAIAAAGSANKQSTVSLNDLEYVPTESYATLFHNGYWGNLRDAPESEVTFGLLDDLGARFEAKVRLKSARNEGISVNPEIHSSLLNVFRDRNKVFSSYIPGIAGIPLSEEKLSRLHVFRKAASGDANVVLRNILLLLNQLPAWDSAIDAVREVYADQTIEFSVAFDEHRHLYVESALKSASITGERPLELAGTGLLQVLQIFSYLYFFKPKVILIDEPEAHLHPPLQTRLLKVLQKRVKDVGTAAIISTHSPFVANGLYGDGKTVWLDKGRVAAASVGGEIREALGWGALDKKAIICTEDGRTAPLARLLEQDIGLDRDVAIVPFSGVSKLGSATALAAFRSALGDRHRVLVYRDRDGWTNRELSIWAEEYVNSGFVPLYPDGSDIEMMFCNPILVSALSGVSLSDAEEMIDSVFDKLHSTEFNKFRKKRSEVNNKLYPEGGSPKTEELWEEMDRTEKFLGKHVKSALNEKLNNTGFSPIVFNRPMYSEPFATAFLSRVSACIAVNDL